ncbi:MAG: L,D-transpeptidase [Sulfitobacter sp.]
MPSVSRRLFLTSGAASVAAAPAFSATQPYQIPKDHHAKVVKTKPGIAPYEIHLDPGNFMLYWTLPNQQAIRYVVGIGQEGRYIPGTFRIGRKREWPSWTPTKAMIRREPHLYKKFAAGMPGGPENPLGARALYLYSGNRDSLLRIHGTPSPWNVGRAVSNGCVRMINSHAIDLYNRAPTGTRVVLH